MVINCGLFLYGLYRGMRQGPITELKRSIHDKHIRDIVPILSKTMVGKVKQ